MSVLAEKHFHDEAAAYEWVEARVWPQGPVCPHCGSCERISKMQGKSTRIGAYKCYACRKPFTVKVGTIFESSHIPMHIWLQGIFLLCGSKKGISSNQLHRALGITLKSAWFLSHRIREAMRSGGLAPMGGNSGIVEVDETFIGRKKGEYKRAGGYAHKMAVLTLVDRKGEARSFHIDKATKKNILPIVKANIVKETVIATDEAPQYRNLNKTFDGHESVNHSDEEWVRGQIHTNRAEGYFSVFKRGMRGVYQHCSEKHLHRYLAEYDFRYNARIALGVNDEQRAEKAVRGIVGKRLTYQTAS
ncbi:MAG: IS1595 family transposase [Gammaproteobacteria bacterium]